ncbi:hypothetical protein MPER_06879 [Moniliophthora perniciosa FA553]|nr:hypothetical protein MPER_06879 [Moniliophthora perniciosa FA553]
MRWMGYERHHIVAIGKHLYDQNHGSNCGQWVTITNTENNKVAHGLVRDSCPSCSDNDLVSQGSHYDHYPLFRYFHIPLYFLLGFIGSSRRSYMPFILVSTFEGNGVIFAGIVKSSL